MSTFNYVTLSVWKNWRSSVPHVGSFSRWRQHWYYWYVVIAFFFHVNHSHIDVLVPLLQGVTISHNRVEELIPVLQSLAAKGPNNSAMPSGPPTPTRARTANLNSGMHPILIVSQWLTTTDFMFQFQHELGIGPNMLRGSDSGAISLHTLLHASTPRHSSSPPSISTPPASFTYPPICSPMRAVLPSVSVTRHPLQYGKIRQINSSSPGSAYPVSTRLCKQAASVSQSPPPASRPTLLLASSSPHIHIPPTPASSPSTKMASHVGGTTAISQIGRGPVTNREIQSWPQLQLQLQSHQIRTYRVLDNWLYCVKYNPKMRNNV